MYIGGSDKMKHQGGHCWKGQLKPGQQPCGCAGRKQQEYPGCMAAQGGGTKSPNGLPNLASGVGVYTTGAYELGLRAREFYSFIARRAQVLGSASPAGRLEESHPSPASLSSAYSSFAFLSSMLTLSLSTCGSLACRSFSFSRVSSASKSLAFLSNSLTLPSPTFLKNFCACERIWLRVLPLMKDWIFFQFLPYFSMSSSKRSAYAAVHRPSRVRLRWVSGGDGLLMCILIIIMMIFINPDGDSLKWGIWRKGWFDRIARGFWDGMEVSICGKVVKRYFEEIQAEQGREENEWSCRP